MKIYITARFKGMQNKPEIEALCQAVKQAGHQDFCFIRDIEHYEKIFKTAKEVWDRTKLELQQCHALLLDVSDQPSGGRVVEAGMAFAWELPIYVVAKRGTTYKDFYNGIATHIFYYDSFEDITKQLAKV